MLAAGQFSLAAYVPAKVSPAGILTIYIEGDGLAWISSSEPSLDPTPVHAIGFELALRHPYGVAAYLARPCQFIQSAHAGPCSSTYWTTRRFAPEVIDATNLAVDQLKKHLHATELALVGYSGGGAIAALVAARRNDVIRLVTVAGNLDHAAWTRLHRLTALKQSLNPADVWQSLENIPQLHLVGARDSNITPEITQSFLARFRDTRNAKMRIIKDFDHECCWTDRWAGLIAGSGR